MRLGASVPGVEESAMAVAQTTDDSAEAKARREDTRKRRLEEMTGDVTEAEMEEYRRKKQLAADPMANYRGHQEAV